MVKKQLDGNQWFESQNFSFNAAFIKMRLVFS